MNLALFDFDGTITDADMYTKFLHYSGTKPRKVVGNLLLAPCFLVYIPMLKLADEQYMNWQNVTEQSFS